MSNSVLPCWALSRRRAAGGGEEPVGACARARQAKLILVACDAAENSARRAPTFAQAGGAPGWTCPSPRRRWAPRWAGPPAPWRPLPTRAAASLVSARRPPARALRRRRRPDTRAQKAPSGRRSSAVTRGT